MPARIRIESGISAGTSYWIDRPVLRVGSDPQCEICLPTADLAPHALTVEFRGGTYRAYNRSASPVAIGSVMLQPGGAAIWSGDETARLPGDLQLVLDIDDDPRPSPRPETAIDDGLAGDDAPALGAETASSAPLSPKSNKKTLLQLAVIGLCAAAAAAFLLMPRAAATQEQKVPSFNAIVVSSLDADEQVQRVVGELQFAETFLVRGRYDISRALFAQLRDRLVRHTDSLPEADQDDAKQILAYVELRLSQLQ